MARNKEESASGAEAAKGTGGTALDLIFENGASGRLVVVEAKVQEEKAVFDAVELLVSEAVRRQLEKESES